jgi:hypothetical protein
MCRVVRVMGRWVTISCYFLLVSSEIGDKMIIIGLFFLIIFILQTDAFHLIFPKRFF